MYIFLLSFNLPRIIRLFPSPPAVSPPPTFLLPSLTPLLPQLYPPLPSTLAYSVSVSPRSFLFCCREGEGAGRNFTCGWGSNVVYNSNKWTAQSHILPPTPPPACRPPLPPPHPLAASSVLPLILRKLIRGKSLAICLTVIRILLYDWAPPGKTLRRFVGRLLRKV